MKTHITKTELEKLLNGWMAIHEYEDYGPNGLQIQGKENLGHIAFALSATRESAEKSQEIGADALIVHHGLFWKFHGTKILTGPFYHRVAPLIKGDINLFAYHLPLDGHMEFGNAKTLGNLLGLKAMMPFGTYKKKTVGVSGHFDPPMGQEELAQHIKAVMNKNHLIIAPGNSAKKIRSLAIITGGAKDEWKEASDLGFDAYLTGEMSEHHYNEACEAGIMMIAAGHYATECFGIMALKSHLETYFKNHHIAIKTSFISSDNQA